MHSIGTDIIEIARVKKAIARWGDVFLRRVYTDAELRLYRQKPSSLAARFAGKEAVMKALGIPTEAIGWKEIEILSESGGKPSLRLHGKAQAQANSLEIDNLAISLSHSKEYAIAFVTGETIPGNGNRAQDWL